MLKRLYPVLLILVIGCGSKDPVSPIEDPEMLIPYKVGNSWTYKIIIGGDGSSVEMLTTEKVLSTVQFSGSGWYRVETTQHYNNLKYSYFYQNRSDGVYMKLTTDMDPFLFLKFPCAVGEQFTFGDGTMEVVSIHEQITVKAGSFSCHHYRALYGDGNQMDVYASPNKGLVKRLVKYSDGDTYSQELMEMSLN